MRRVLELPCARRRVVTSTCFTSSLACLGGSAYRCGARVRGIAVVAPDVLGFEPDTRPADRGSERQGWWFAAPFVFTAAFAAAAGYYWRRLLDGPSGPRDAAGRCRGRTSNASSAKRTAGAATPSNRWAAPHRTEVLTCCCISKVARSSFSANDGSPAKSACPHPRVVRRGGG